MREMIRRLNFGDKKKNGVIYVILLLGALCFLFGSFGKSERAKESGAGSSAVSYEEERELETRLAAILSQMEGVGEAEVMITYRDDGAEKLAQNTRAADRSSEYQTVMASGGGENRPYVVGRERPRVQGVLVIADGGRDPAVQEKIKEAACAVLGVEPHRAVVSGRRVK